MCLSFSHALPLTFATNASWREVTGLHKSTFDLTHHGTLMSRVISGRCYNHIFLSRLKNGKPKKDRSGLGPTYASPRRGHTLLRWDFVWAEHGYSDKDVYPGISGVRILFFFWDSSQTATVIFSFTNDTTNRNTGRLSSLIIILAKLLLSHRLDCVMTY